MTLKVMTIVGTRPEVIKLSRVIAEFDRHFRHVLVHTGQNYSHELNEIFFEQLGIRKPDHFLDAADANVAKAIGQILVRSDEILRAEKPDALLVLGDTNSCLAVIAAKRLKVPIFHMEAGNRCFDARVPEETNRKIIDHLSDINLPYTEHARRYLLAEGLKPDTVIKTGSPMREVLEFYRQQIHASDVITRLNLGADNYFVVSAHREENVDDRENLGRLMRSLQMLWDCYRLPIIVSTHPRTRKRLDDFALGVSGGDVRFLSPMGFPDYVHLQMHARCVLSDSGTLTEESAILGFPAVMIRNVHERPEGMDNATLIMSGLEPEFVIASVEMAIDHARSDTWRPGTISDYEVTNVSSKVARIIQSYTRFVNCATWHR